MKWVRCDKCGKYTLTPYKDYGYVLCPHHRFVITKMIRKYMSDKE
jgi:hypothetical protein